LRILIITEHFPYPPIAGTPIRSFNLLSRLARKHEVWLASFIRPPEDVEALRRMQSICRGIATAPARCARAYDRPGEALRYLLGGKPFELRLYMSGDFAEKIRGLVSAVEFDVVEIIDSYMALYLEILPDELRSKTILTFIDVVFSRSERISRLDTRLARKLRNRLYGRMMRQWEPKYAARFARCITVSGSDRDLLLAANPRLNIDIVPNGVDAHGYQPLPEPPSPGSLIFVGNMGYQPNVDAMTWFCERILPLVRREVPGIELWIVGKSPTPEVMQLEGGGVSVTGRVADLRPFYERSSVSVVPLRGGGGTRLKILESMALGRPVVSTTIGCEGLEVVDGEHLLIADRPEEFAERVVRLLKDNGLRRRLMQRARELVEGTYDWDIISEKLERIYGEVAK
jgi:sugar transferase (PEP-CTERM/EpsH1 system associated)